MDRDKLLQTVKDTIDSYLSKTAGILYDKDKLSEMIADGIINNKSITIPKTEKSPADKFFAEANKQVDDIIANAQKAKDSWNGREKVPEPIRELLDAYVKLTGQKPTKSQLFDWLNTGSEWLELGAQAIDVKDAYAKANPDKGNGFFVNRPGSLTNTIGMVVGTRRQKTTVKVDPIQAMNEYIERSKK